MVTQRPAVYRDKQRLLQSLLPALDGSRRDTAGFAAPFSALVLAEVPRTDRIRAWMTGEQRNLLVTAAAGYLSVIRDYRGFDDKDGWRHGVAHGSDLALQLALNPAVEKSQLDVLLDAVGSQVAPAGHSYIYGEPERLLRPVLYIAQRGLHDEKQWQSWLDRLTAPAPLASWDEAYLSSGGLARRHNLRTFLGFLQVNTQDSPDKNWQSLNRLAVAALKQLP